MSREGHFGRGRIRDRKWHEYLQSNQVLLDECPGLRGNFISEQMRRAVHDNNIDQQFEQLEDGRCLLTPANYTGTFEKLLFAEEFYKEVQMRMYDQQDSLQVNLYHSAEYSRIILPGLSKGQPSLIAGDWIVLKNGREFEACEIVSLEGDNIHFERPRMCIPDTDRLKVAFVSAGHTYQRLHQALADFRGQKRLIRRAFFDEDLPSGELIREPKIDMGTSATNEILDERLARCNEPQYQAIVGILEAKCRPKPYIVFGPPGTGKSFTVVEAVVQICGREPGLRVLVCANSNNCADQLAAALERDDRPRWVQSSVRLCSRARYLSGGSEDVNCIQRKPLLEEGVYNYRVIVTTNNMAGALRGHEFDCVFVDEAGHGHEPEILIPASLLKRDGLLVLAGDPKQLGPVIRNPRVEKLGLGRSMLERMLELLVYARDPDQGYDKDYITQLTYCYRCDPRILKLCNKLFYHDELSCLGRTPPSLLKRLKIRHPLLFCAVQGSEDRIESSTSIKNQLEAEMIVDMIMLYYMIGIDPDMIGVITFYALQEKLIRAKLKRRLLLKFNNEGSAMDKDTFLNKWLCKVNTVDGFQGNEREIIIISTVRCPDSSSGRIERSGFLVDSKRFNVAFSRAKWLTIVVGHPAVLGCHENWREFEKHQVEYNFSE